jgi:hypothetical protein
MKRIILSLTALSLLSSGCTLFEKNEPPVKAPPIKVAPKAVKAGNITPENARDKAKALEAELNADADGEFD